MGKRIAFPGSYYDTRRFEAWLGQRSSEGLRFYKFSSHGKITVFEHKKPQRIRYYVEPDFDQYTPEEMEKAYMDLGWTFVDELRGTCLVYETEEPWASKPHGQFEEEDWCKKWRKLLLGQVGLFFLEIISIYFILKPFWQLSGTKEPVSIAIAVMFISSCFLILQNLWSLGANLYDIYAWNRCIRMNEETDEWRGIVILRWGEVILFWLLISTLLLTYIISIPAL